MTGKRQQLLLIDPANEIVFRGPFDRVVTSFIQLNNPIEESIGFKIKTTAPKRYCVRPNSGIVEPGSHTRIAIMLQPIENDSQSERSKHKFMVQSIVLNEQMTNIDSLWLTAKPEEIMDSKLKCVFRESDDEASSGASKTAPTSTSTSDSPTTQSATPKNTTSVSTSRLPLITSADAFSQNLKKIEEHEADKSVASSHSRSFILNHTNDDRTIVVFSLLMLFVGILLGKYII